MDQRTDSQKRRFSDLEGSNLTCPDCKDLEEHRNKNCTKQLTSTGASGTTDASIFQESPAKRKFHQCQDCHIYLRGFFRNEDNFLRENYNTDLKSLLASIDLTSFETVLDDLKDAMIEEQNALYFLEEALNQTANALEHYNGSLKDHISALEVCIASLENEKKICTHENANGHKLGCKICESFQKLEEAKENEEMKWELFNKALHSMRDQTRATMCFAIKVHFAHSETIRAFKDRRFAVIPADILEVVKEMKGIECVLKEKHEYLDDLNRTIDASEIEFLRVFESRKSRISETEREEAPTLAGDQDIDEGQLNYMDTTPENLSDSKPSTSGTRSGNEKESEKDERLAREQDIDDGELNCMDTTPENMDEPKPSISGKCSGYETEGEKDKELAREQDINDSQLHCMVTTPENFDESKSSTSGTRSGYEKDSEKDKMLAREQDIDDAQLNVMDTSLENLDDQKPPTSETYSGYTQHSYYQDPDDMN